MQKLALWILAYEAAQRNPSEVKVQEAMCIYVCEKLRIPLATLAGAAGYSALISRALALARRQVPSLGLVQVKKNGSLEVPGTVESQRDMDETMRGGVELVAQLLGLLVTFIGERLTLRLVRDVWPDAPYEVMDSEMEIKP